MVNPDFIIIAGDLIVGKGMILRLPYPSLRRFKKYPIYCGLVIMNRVIPKGKYYKQWKLFNNKGLKVHLLDNENL